MVSLTEELKLVRIGFVVAHPACILGYKLLNLGDNVKHLILNLILKIQAIRRLGNTELEVTHSIDFAGLRLDKANDVKLPRRTLYMLCV
jgi:hypothetical protein